MKVLYDVVSSTCSKCQTNKAILAKMETFLDKKVQKMTEKFDFEQQLLIAEESGEKNEGKTYKDAIEVQSGDEGNEHERVLFKNRKTNEAELHKNIHYHVFLSLPLSGIVQP